MQEPVVEVGITVEIWHREATKMNKREGINKNLKNEWRTREMKTKIRYLSALCEGHWWLLSDSVHTGGLNWRNGESKLMTKSK